MGKNALVWVIGFSLALGGCAAIQQAKSDYDLGKATPIAEGEVAPQQAAEDLVSPLLPFIPEPVRSPVGSVLVSALALFGTFRRGRRIRLGKGTTANPITGELGDRIKLEGLVQIASDVSVGAFNWGDAGVKRTVKVAIASAIPALLLLVPQVHDLVAQNIESAVGFMAIATALVAGAEKELSRILVTVKPPETTTPA